MLLLLQERGRQFSLADQVHRRHIPNERWEVALCRLNVLGAVSRPLLICLKDVTYQINLARGVLSVFTIHYIIGRFN